MASNFEPGPELTETQEQLLQSAVNAGYFKVPREISLVELATNHSMSGKEASQELRRGVDAVVRDATLED